MYHNQQLTLAADKRATFRGPIIKKKLSPPTRLFRFMTIEQNYELGEFWFDNNAMRKMQSFIQDKDITLPEVARSWLAVKEQWNEKMDQVVCIELTKPAYAWIGRTQSQTKTNFDNVHFMGNLEQVFLPGLFNLKGDQICFKMISFIHAENY